VVKTFHPCRVRPIKTPLYKTLLPILLKVIHCNYCLNSCKTLSCSCRKKWTAMHFCQWTLPSYKM